MSDPSGMSDSRFRSKACPIHVFAVKALREKSLLRELYIAKIADMSGVLRNFATLKFILYAKHI